MQWLIDSTLVAVPRLDASIIRQDTLEDDQLNEAALSADPLVPVGTFLRTRYVYSWLEFKFVPSAIVARREVVRRLRRAQERLPKGIDIVVIDGWRPREFQEELRSHYTGKVPDHSDFVADPGDTTRTPPHLTGGALDLTLGWRGTALGLGTDYDEFTPMAAPDAFENRDSDPVVRDLRRLLAHSLTGVGFVCDPLEWWHWSFGDDWWAIQNGRDEPLFAEVEADSLLLNPLQASTR